MTGGMGCRSLSIALLLGLAPVVCPAQHDSTHTTFKDRMAVFHDTLDGALDVSRFLIEMNGFLPVPMVITEPALGSFGGMLGLVFLERKKIPPGLTDANGKPVYVPPDITLAGGMYTANGSWAALGGRIGTILPWKLRYRIFSGYADINMDFYRTLPVVGEQRIGMNMRAVPVMVQAIEKIGRSNWYLGGQYTWADMRARPSSERFTDVFPEKERTNVTSVLGAVAEYDGRDNFFTPKRGIDANAFFKWSGKAIGSASEYTLLQVFSPFYIPVNTNWTCGLRGEYQRVWGDPFFYQIPYVNMRGIPTMRYQGRTIAQAETEQNFRVWRRWSMVAFGGVGKAFDEGADFSDAELVYGYGVGPRYLIARAFGLQMGVDVARGPEQFAWYVVFGSAWLR